MAQAEINASNNVELNAYIAQWRNSDNCPHHLSEHLESVGYLAGEFARKLGIQSAGNVIGTLHDLGKYSKEFQNYIRSALGLVNCDEDDYVDSDAIRGKVDHSSAGAQYVWNALAPKGGIELRIAQMLSLCIASHHSGIIDCLDADGQDTFGKRMQKSREKTHLDEVKRNADSTVLNLADRQLASPELLTELKSLLIRIIAANTIDSFQNGSNTQQHFGLATRFLFSCLIDADRIDTADFEHKRSKKYRPNGDYIAWSQLIQRLERHLATLPAIRAIDTLRCEISKHCLAAAPRPKGIYTLAVPTGGGKTLASLRFALHHAGERKLDRIIYVIPFTSIIDQNAKVVREILESNTNASEHGKIVLEHHASITPEQQTWREKMLCENWDAPVVYTTMVQFLESLFGSGTRGARRMHQLSNAVLIFDEVQTLPIKCVHLFNNAINFLVEQCNSTVVLCTATQPLLHEVLAEKGALRLALNHEIMPDVQKLFDDLKRVDVIDARKPAGWSQNELAQLAIDEMARAASCLVIVNTKRAAQAIFKLCQAREEQGTMFHLSTDMCPAHRKATLEQITSRLKSGLPTLCVSTQLIEAGVDVDFGAVIRFLAGLDSIAQAAGRCNRNGRSKLGIVRIVNPRVEDESLDKLPDIQKGCEIAKRVLDDFRQDPSRYRNNLFGPEALSEYYRYYFFERKNEMSYPVSKEDKNVRHDDTLLSLLSANTVVTQDCNAVPDRLLNQSFMAAAKAFKTIDAPTQGVIVPYGENGKALVAKLFAAYDIELDFDLMRAAQQFTVNVFPHVLEKLKKENALTEVKTDTRILSLDQRFYSPLFGLSTEHVSPLENLYASS
jgi:CRISPR-associated endonuclease/helicase Cas3